MHILPFKGGSFHLIDSFFLEIAHNGTENLAHVMLVGNPTKMFRKDLVHPVFRQMFIQKTVNPRRFFWFDAFSFFGFGVSFTLDLEEISTPVGQNIG